MTKSVRTLLLYEDKGGCKLLRETTFAAGGEVEETPFDPRAAACVAMGYSVVLFSVRQPACHFFEILRAWHDNAPETTLVVVSGRASQADRLAGLEAGASAYFTELLTVAELAAHVRAALHRFRTQVVPVCQLSLGHTVVDFQKHMVLNGDKQLHLTKTQYGILDCLAARLNQTVPCKDLAEVVWGSDPRKGCHSLRSFIRQLRQKLEPDPAKPQYLITDPTNGYRLQTPGTCLSSTQPRRPKIISGNHACEVGGNIRDMSLGRLRIAIRKNCVSFPSQIPSFSCPPKAEIQWRLAALFFVHGWPCTGLRPRYGLCVKYVEKLILDWTRRAINSGYLQEIPALELPTEWPGAFASPDAQPGNLWEEIEAEAPVVRAAQRDIAVTAAHT